MYLRRIELRDFKAYEHAVFDFPRPQGGRNVILIGGLNGFGKTTLFEAIALGLYGRDALSLINRARPGIDDEERRVSFRSFMKGALHAAALSAGRSSTSITLEFEDRHGRPYRLTRIWHYSDTGELRPDPEELRLLEGVSRRPIGPPDDEPYPENWYREWIFRNFLPTNQASFFLFDGEAASVFAERDMTTQIRESIEGLLGLSWLRRLGEDLKRYADNRRTQIPRGSGDDILRLQGEIASVEQDFKAKEERLRAINMELADAEVKRDRLLKELSGYGPGTQAKLQELIEDRTRQEKVFEEAESKLAFLAESDLPLALVGQRLHEKTDARLDQEAKRERWLAGREETRSRIEMVWSEIDRRLDEVLPPIAQPQRAAVKSAIEAGLDRLWNPPPPGIPPNLRHPHATGGTNARIRHRLERARNVRLEIIKGLANKINETSAKIKELRRLIESIELAGPALEAKRRELRDLTTRIEGLNREKGEIENALRSKGPELRQKRSELARLTERVEGSAPFLRRAARADQIREMLDALVEEAWPLQAGAIAQEMTRAVQNMAHRSDYFHKVEISPSGELRLLSRDGRNMRELDLSAGEKQIFTQALFAAVAKVSGRTFPLVIDTPLGRLDEEHRLNVLRHLADREGQVILISTNTEVVGPYLEAIRPKIAKAYRLESVTRGDIRVTFPVPGYFPGAGLDVAV
jgi:DNA sulfur modification protein DndD